MYKNNNTILLHLITLFITDNISVIQSISFKSSHSKFISIKFKNKILHFSYRHAIPLFPSIPCE